MPSGFVSLTLSPVAALPVDGQLLIEAWKLLSHHGLALHQYNLSRSTLYGTRLDLYAERARIAELHARIALAASLVAVNELRDTGQGERVLRELIDQPEKLTMFDVASGVAQAVEFLRQELPSVPTELLELMPSLIDQLQLRLGVSTTDKDAQVELTQGGTVCRCTVLTSVNSPRVTLEEFFGRSVRAGHVVAPGPWVPPRSPDWYFGCMLSLAATREWAYRNARNAAELGPPAVRAGAPLVIAFAVGVVMLVVGGILKSSCGSKHAICELGDILTVFGVLLEAAGGLGLLLLDSDILPPGQPQIPSWVSTTPGPVDQIAANAV